MLITFSNRQLQAIGHIKKAVAEIVTAVTSMTGCPQHHIYRRQVWDGYVLSSEFKEGVHRDVRKAFPEASLYWDPLRLNTFVVDYSYLPN